MRFQIDDSLLVGVVLQDLHRWCRALLGQFRLAGSGQQAVRISGTSGRIAVLQGQSSVFAGDWRGALPVLMPDQLPVWVLRAVLTCAFCKKVTPKLSVAFWLDRSAQWGLVRACSAVMVCPSTLRVCPAAASILRFKTEVSTALLASVELMPAPRATILSPRKNQDFLALSGLPVT